LLALRGLLFFCMLFGHMPPDQAAADRADHRVMSGIVSRHSTYYRPLHAAGRVCRADRCRSKRHRREGGSHVTSFHLKVPFN